jgi:hypothetical protein
MVLTHGDPVADSLGRVIITTKPRAKAQDAHAKGHSQAGSTLDGFKMFLDKVFGSPVCLGSYHGIKARHGDPKVMSSYRQQLAEAMREVLPPHAFSRIPVGRAELWPPQFA